MSPSFGMQMALRLLRGKRLYQRSQEGVRVGSTKQALSLPFLSHKAALLSKISLLRDNKSPLSDTQRHRHFPSRSQFFCAQECPSSWLLSPPLAPMLIKQITLLAQVNRAGRGKRLPKSHGSIHLRTRIPRSRSPSIPSHKDF